jgi:hypothetical protein
MNAFRSEASTFRPHFVLAAIALTLLTLALGIVAPAHLAPAGQSADVLLASKSGAPQATEVIISPARIDVVGRRA